MGERLGLVFSIALLATFAYLWISRREGRVTRVVDAPGGVSSETLGAPRGFRATFVQFSTDTCAKCPPTAVLLRRVAGSHTGVAHIEIDAVERLDLARRFDVLRTPTILVINHEGLVVARISGAPSEAQAREALAAAPLPTTDYSI